MKRSPFGAVSVRPTRLMLTPLFCCCTELTNTFCTVVASPDIDSTKYTRSLFPVSPNTPGLTRETSSRASSRVTYCAPICAAHGEMMSDSAAITAICGSANSITGLSHAVSDSPGAEPDHHLGIAPAAREREQHRDEHGERSSTGSVPRAKKPRNAITASVGIWPPAACPSRRMSRVVSAMANSVMKTAPARLANSLRSARWKIMRYFRCGI
jgi:hypothetical protein